MKRWELLMLAPAVVMCALILYLIVTGLLEGTEVRQIHV